MSNGNTKKDAGVLQNTCHPERGTTEGSATAQRISYRFPHPLARIRNDNTRHIINLKTLKNVNDIHNIRKSNAPPLIRGKPFIGLEARSSLTRGWLLLYYSLGSLDCRRGYFACNANRAAQIVMKTSVAHCAHPANIEVAGQLTETGEQKCTGHCRAIQLVLNKGRSPVLHRFNPFAGDSCFSSAVGRTSSLADQSRLERRESKDVSGTNY